MPIALPDFLTEPGVPDPGMGRNITQIIASNLRRSGLFAPLDPTTYIEKITDINRQPRFNDWRQINADALVTGRLERQANGNRCAVQIAHQPRSAQAQLGAQALLKRRAPCLEKTGHQRGRDPDR